tara:strand:- start:874 stop:1434 length:561 start_codon:yes stop_codon:yes gene_type:complete
VNDQAFKNSTALTAQREGIMGAALARHFGCSLIFNEDPKRRQLYDYALFSPERGFALTCEHQDEYFTTTMAGQLCLELYTLAKNHKKKGKLLYTTANRLIYVINNIKKVLIIDLSILKKMVVDLEAAGQLETYTPEDHDAWKEKHDTLPTTCALVPIEEVLIQAPQTSVITFEELNIPTSYEKLRP